MAIENPHEIPFPSRHFPWERRKDADVFPDGNRMAVSFYVAAEEWEWDEVEPGPPKRNRRDEHGLSLSTQTGVLYGFDVGLRRMADVFDDEGVSVTFFTTGNAVEQHPDVLAEMHDRGHEITAHHWSEGRGSVNFDLDGMREDVRKTADVIEELTGERPVGWLGPGAVSTEETIRALAEEGFLYNADQFRAPAQCRPFPGLPPRSSELAREPALTPGLKRRSLRSRIPLACSRHTQGVRACQNGCSTKRRMPTSRPIPASSRV